MYQRKIKPVDKGFCIICSKPFKNYPNLVCKPCFDEIRQQEYITHIHSQLDAEHAISFHMPAICIRCNGYTSHEVGILCHPCYEFVTRDRLIALYNLWVENNLGMDLTDYLKQTL